MKKAILFFFILAISLFMFTAPLFAFTLDGGRTVIVKENIDGNLYLWGGSVSVRSNINGDLYVVGGRFNLNGNISDDLTAIGAFGFVGGTVSGDVRIAGGVVTLNGQVNGDVMVAGGVVIVDTNCIVMGDLIIAGGSLNVLGEVEGNLIATGGSIEILGEIKGNVEIKNAASLNIRNTAVIGGDLIYSSGKKAGISEGAEIKGNIIFNEKVTTQSQAQASASKLISATGIDKNLINYAASLDPIVTDSARQTLITVAANEPEEEGQSFWGAIAGFFRGIFTAIFIIFKSLYFIGMFIFGIVLIFLIPALFRRFNERMKSSLGKCVAGGAITLFGVPIGMIIIWAISLVLLFTIIGSAFSIILFATAGIIGFIYLILIFISTIFLSYLIGGLILSKSKMDPTKYGVKVLAFFIGFIILETLYAIPVIGQVSQLIGILFGLGGISIIIYEWIRYKVNPFSVQESSRADKSPVKK